MKCKVPAFRQAKCEATVYHRVEYEVTMYHVVKSDDISICRRATLQSEGIFAIKHSIWSCTPWLVTTHFFWAYCSYCTLIKFVSVGVTSSFRRIKGPKHGQTNSHNSVLCTTRDCVPTRYDDLMFIGPCIIVIVEEWKTNLMSLATLFHFLCVQHVSDINTSIIRSLPLFCWITTLVVLFLVRCVLEFRCGWVGVVAV